MYLKLNSTQNLVLKEILKDLDDACRQDYDCNDYDKRKKFLLRNIEKFIDELADNGFLKK